MPVYVSDICLLPFERIFLEGCLSVSMQAVQDLDWDPAGRYLLSVSSDQTARIFAQWRARQRESASTPPSWHEIARPQVHGYDMQCVCMAAADGTRYVSGADEKLLRVFEAPSFFIKSCKKIRGDSTEGSAEDTDAAATGDAGGKSTVMGSPGRCGGCAQA